MTIYSYESEKYSQFQKCLYVSKIIDNVFAAGPGTDWNGFFDENVILFSEKYIIVGDLNLDADILSAGVIEQFEGEVAYYSCGSETRELYTLMLNRGADFYYAPVCSLVNDTDLNSLLTNINDYNAIFMEDPRMQFPTYRHIFDSWVSNGGRLVVTEYMYENENGPLMDRTWKRNTGNTDCPTTIVDTHPDFPLSVGQSIVFEKCPNVVPYKDVNVLAEYDDPPKNRAGSLWFNYGLGDVFYFSDLAATVDNSDLNFVEVVGANVNFNSKPVLLEGNYAFCEHSALVTTVKLANDEVLVRNVGGIVIASNK